MSDFVSYQAAFHQANFGEDQTPANKMIVPFGLSGEQRLSIYKNNIFISLTEALSQTFPVVEKLVGEDFFAFTAKTFIKERPPIQGPLFEYGNQFPDFLKSFEPASSLPYLPDIAHLEWAMNTSFHAENISPINATDLSQFSDDEFSNLLFKLHPSFRIINSEYPIYDIWLLNQDDTDEMEIDLAKASNVIIFRPDDQVLAKEISNDTSLFIKALQINENIEKSYISVAQINPEFDAAMAMVELLSIGIFSNVLKNGNPALKPAKHVTKHVTKHEG